MSVVAEREPVLIRRYARSRLYDACGSRYVSVEQLHKWAAEGVSFFVIDIESGEDITRVLLA